MQHLDTLKNETPLREVFMEFAAPIHDRKRIWALVPLGKVRLFFRLLLILRWGTSGITNKALQGMIGGTPWSNGSGKAIIATARKMLEIIYNTLKHDLVFEDFNNFVLAN
jgi:hypothetical protein